MNIKHLLSCVPWKALFVMASFVLNAEFQSVFNSSSALTTSISFSLTFCVAITQSTLPVHGYPLQRSDLSCSEKEQESKLKSAIKLNPVAKEDAAFQSPSSNFWTFVEWMDFPSCCTFFVVQCSACQWSLDLHQLTPEPVRVYNGVCSGSLVTTNTVLTWEKFSLSPATHVQCAEEITPSSWIIIHGVE